MAAWSELNLKKNTSIFEAYPRRKPTGSLIHTHLQHAYTHIYIHMYIYVYIYVCMYVCVYNRNNIDVCARGCVFAMYLCTFIHIHIHIRIRIRIHKHILVHLRAPIRIRIHTHTYCKDGNGCRTRGFST